MPEKKQVEVKPAKGRPMLTWVGKRPLRHVTAFPAQLAERHDALGIIGFPGDDDSRYDERMQLFRDLRSQCNDKCWKNQPEIGIRAPENGGLLFHGDNKEVLAFLLANGYRAKVNLIYIDPPFDSAADYVRKVQLRGVNGAAKVDGETYTLGEQVQYTDIWANDNYLQFIYERLLLLKELLADNGNIYIHTDWHKGHHLRCLMDEVFGPESFRNEIVWRYSKYQMRGMTRFVNNHDSLYWYSKGDVATYNLVTEPLDQPKSLKRKRWDKENGKIVNVRDANGKLVYDEYNEAKVDDVWDIDIIGATSGERSDYPTQKPETLIARILETASNPGDLVLDCFIGSGTTAAVAQKLGRRWIACDINKGAIQIAAKRLRGIISTQIEEALAATKSGKQGKLLKEHATSESVPKPAQFGFTIYRVNDYDLQIQHNEAVNLACEHIGVTRTRADSYFDGVMGKKLVKIIPFGHPLTPLDLEELKMELAARPDEERDVVVVSLGKELTTEAWVDEWNRLRKKGDVPNKIEIIELRTDPKYGKFFEHKPARAKVSIKRAKGKIVVEIEDFISPTVIERLQQQAGVLRPKITDWRSMVDSVMIDAAYDGKVFNVALSDVPAKKADLVGGKYEIPAPKGKSTVAVKITDVLGEEVLVTKVA